MIRMCHEQLQTIVIYLYSRGYYMILPKGGHAHGILKHAGYKAYENLGIEKAWVIIWITEKEELDDFMEKRRVCQELQGHRKIRR